MRLAFFCLPLLACSAPTSTPVPVSSSPPTLPSASVADAAAEAGPVAEGDLPAIAERGWASWLRGARAEALSDFGTVVSSHRLRYPTQDTVVSAGVSPNHEVALGSTFGVVATSAGLLVFRTDTGAPVTWRAFPYEARAPLSLRGDAEVLARDNQGMLQVLELPSLKTRATFSQGPAWSAAASSADGSLLAYETWDAREAETESLRVVDRVTGTQRWSIPSGVDRHPFAHVEIAPDSATLVALSAFVSSRGPHFEELLLLRAADGYVLFRTSVASGPAADGRIAPAEITPPTRFVERGAALDYRDPKTGRTTRVDTRTGKTKASPSPLAWSYEAPRTEVRIPARLDEQLCHASDFPLPAEACRR